VDLVLLILSITDGLLEQHNLDTQSFGQIIPLNKNDSVTTTPIVGIQCLKRQQQRFKISRKSL